MVDLTIILPTRNEAENIQPLILALEAALATGRWSYELLFVDDSDDTTLWTAGVSWYHSGKNAKWNAEVSNIDSDLDALEAFVVQIGLTVGSST